MRFPSSSPAHLLLLLPVLALGACADEGISALSEIAIFDPATIDFGEVTVGTTGARMVQLRNTGQAALEIQSVETAASFSLRGSKGALEGVRLAPGTALDLEVLFLSQEEGEKSGTITVYFERAEAKLEVRAMGVIDLVPDLKLEPAALNFGTVEVGQESRLGITIRNDGTAAGTIDTASLESTGGLGSPFDVAGISLPLTLEPGQSAQYDIVFKPTVEGAIADKITFGTQAPQQPLILTLNGTGAPARGGLVCTPSALEFGQVERGQSGSQAVTCTARNGIARFVGASFPNGQNLFIVSMPPGTADLTEGQSVSFFAEFWAEGAPMIHNVTLSVQYDGAGGVGTVEIPVRGEVIPPPVTQTAMSLLLRWDLNFTDVDLHLVRPGGALWDTNGGDCYFGQPAPDWGLLNDPTDDPFLDVDDVDGFGPENINLSVAAPGNYEVYVHYYSDNGIGNSNATIEVYIAGNLAGTFNRGLGCNDSWHAGTIVWDGINGVFMPSSVIQSDSRGFCF